MFILSSPSGTGKTTIARRLLAEDGEIAMSVSVTTRPPRPGEIEGTDYHFVDQARFAQMVDDGEMLEWAEVFGNNYGTPKSHIKAGLKEGRDFLFDIDWQGTQQLYQRMETDVVRVFLLPPSIGELETRLRHRATDSEAVREAKSAIGMVMITWWSTTISTPVSKKSARYWRPNGCAARGRRGWSILPAS
jgi:guanylate kinase